MNPNLLEKWPDLDSLDLRILLHERIGGTGQAYLRDPKPTEFFLPKAGASCEVVLTFKGRKVIALKAGPAFDAARWQQISDEIDKHVIAGPMKVGREYSFMVGREIAGSWRGQRSGVQILRAPADAPRPDIASGDFPFILEFPVMEAKLEKITNYRRMRKHRDLTLLLNILLVGGTSYMGYLSQYFWSENKWVPRSYNANLGPCLIDQLSPPAAELLEEIPSEEYEDVGRCGGVGSMLRVPSDLDQSICSYEALVPKNREKFDRASFWFGTASAMRHISMSAFFAAFVSAIEALTLRASSHDFKFCPVCGKPGSHEIRSARRTFESFLMTYAADAVLEEDRKQVYRVRSEILHGSDLMELDQSIPIGNWTPTGFKEGELYNSMWKVTRHALRNWLKSPPPLSRYLQNAREVCAYYHWDERGRPIGTPMTDWEWAQQVFPDQ